MVEDEESCEGVGKEEGLPGPDGSFIYVLHNIRWYDLYWSHYKVDTEDAGGVAASESYFHACRNPRNVICNIVAHFDCTFLWFFGQDRLQH